jgi:pimeloyl-ACP methyl ester carboxylesterase
MNILPRTHSLPLAALSLLFLIFSTVCAAETVREKLPSGLYGVAEYRQGDVSKPAVLVLHGFLTTHNFNTVLGIVDLLTYNSYPVLAPTLTLNINARQGGLACDAIHTHTMEQDLAEIGFWINWLTGRGHKQIILIGHSSGSLELLAYLNQHPAPAVKHLIAASLVYADGFNSPDLVKEQIASAQRRRQQGDHSLQSYTLSYCKGNFLAPPEVYLSYNAWTQERVLQALQQSPVPVTIIMGGKDERFQASWIEGLQQAGPEVIIIPGASHFFDAHHEFDLHDVILSILE